MVIRRLQQDRSLFEVLLPDSDKLWPAWLRQIDMLLEDEAVLDTIAAALEARWPHSRTRGGRDAGRGRPAHADPEAPARLELRRAGAGSARQSRVPRLHAGGADACRMRRQS